MGQARAVHVYRNWYFAVDWPRTRLSLKVVADDHNGTAHLGELSTPVRYSDDASRRNALAKPANSRSRLSARSWCTIPAASVSQVAPAYLPSLAVQPDGCGVAGG